MKKTVLNTRTASGRGKLNVKSAVIASRMRKQGRTDTVTFIDLFSGTGGFRRGMELAGHKCVGFCEIDRFAYMSYISMHLLTDEQREYLSTLDFKARQKEILKDEYRNGEWYADDISRLDARDIPRADCWCFGFPCQDISVAGKQAGFTGNRSSLFFRVMYLLEQIPEENRPHTLFIENVKNLLSINGGWDFARVLSALDGCGYDAEWQVLNSKDFGVPQNRERIFIIGHLRNRRAAEVFPIEGTDGQNNVERIAKKLYSTGKTSENYEIYGTDGISPTLKATGYKEQRKVAINSIGSAREHDGHGVDNNNSIFSPDGCIGAMKAQQYKEPPRTAIKVVGKNIHESGKTNFRSDVISADGVSGTIQATEYKEPTRVAIKVMGTLDANRDAQMDVMSPDGLMRTLDTMHEPKKVAIKVVGTLNSERHSQMDVVSPDGISQTLDTLCERKKVAIEVKNATKQGYDIAQEGVDAIDLQFPDSKLRRARVGHGYAHALDTSCKQGILVTMPNGANAWAVYYPKGDCYVAIRKLTPKECYRLQGWADEYFDRAAFVNSDSQLYRQAGNGVTVPVIEAIARRLCDDV